MNRVVYKNWILFRLMLNMIAAKIKRGGENLGHRLTDLIFYRGKTGPVEWNVPREFADGMIHIRVMDEYGARMETVNFYITNRWPICKGQLPSQTLRLGIMSAALETGLSPVKLTWFTKTARVHELPFMDLVPIDRVTMSLGWRLVKAFVEYIDTPRSSSGDAQMQLPNSSIIRPR